MFRRAPSRVGRGGRAAADFVVCFGLGGFLSPFFFVFNETMSKERSDRGRFLPLGKKKLFIPGCVQGAIVRAKRVSNCYIQKKKLCAFVRVFD